MSDSAGPNDEQAEPVARALAEHRRWLRTVLAARGVERDALDEVLQEVATAALRGAGTLRDARKLAPWLYRVAVTQAALHRRRAGRRRKLVDRSLNTAARRPRPSTTTRWPGCWPRNSSSLYDARSRCCRRATRSSSC